MRRVLLYSGCLLLFLSIFFFSQDFFPDNSSGIVIKKVPLQRKEQKKPERAMKVKVANIAWPEKVKKQPPPTVKIKTKAKKKAYKGQGQIVGKFACDIKFYINQMEKKGAKLVLYERKNGKLYEISDQQELAEISRMDKSYSQTSRRITDDYPDALKIINNAEKLYGPGRYEIILLIPDILEIELKQHLAQITIQKNKVKLNQVSSFFISYTNQNSQLAIKLDRILVGEHMLYVNQTFIF
jgi:hypothetical protein